MKKMKNPKDNHVVYEQLLAINIFQSRYSFVSLFTSTVEVVRLTIHLCKYVLNYDLTIHLYGHGVKTDMTQFTHGNFSIPHTQFSCYFTQLTRNIHAHKRRNSQSVRMLASVVQRQLAENNTIQVEI